MDVKEIKSERLEDQDEVESLNSEEFLGYGAFAFDELVGQMQNAVAFDWEEDVNDPFEKVVARSKKASSKPVNNHTEVSVSRNREASSKTMDEPTETALARSGEASNKPMNDLTEVSKVRSREPSSKPMNYPSEIAEAGSVEASSKPMNDSCEIDVARSGEASNKPMNDHTEVSEVRMRDCEIDVTRNGEASSIPMNNHCEIAVARSGEASRKPLNDHCEVALARSGEASCKQNTLMEHNITYRGHGLGQSDAHTLQGYSKQVGSCQDQEPPKESVDNTACNLNECQKYTWRRQDEYYIRLSRRGDDGRAWQHPWWHSYDRYKEYSPRDTSQSHEESNRYCAMDLPTFQGHPNKSHYSRSSLVSPRREQNRVICRQPHRQSHFSYEKHSPRGFNSIQCNGIKPCLLTEALAECPYFKASLLQLFEWKKMHPSAVKEVVVANEDVFRLNREVVELHPKISICQAHSGPQGCHSFSECMELHICNMYVTSYCQESNCAFGHKWFTDHNKTVLRYFYLESLSAQSLRYLMTRFMKVNGFTGQLHVCYDYNRKGCSKAYCSDLHVCHSVFRLTKCAIPRCNLNHNLLTPDCCERLRACGFSTNETPRDVAKTLLAAFPFLGNGGPAKQVAPLTQAASNNGQDRVSTGILDQRRNTNPSRRNGNVCRGNVRSDNDECARKGKMDVKHSCSSKTTSVAKNGKRRTVWSHYLCGDTQINEICFYSVESTCKYDNNGCQRLHAAQHFHWQISEQGNSWLNLRSFQVKCLERAFCNPAENGVVIPLLDPAKLHSSAHHLLTVLGNDTWHANFQAMVLRNSDFSRILYLRRLCTEFIAGQKIAASIYHWFFLDINKKWVQYGQVDTAGERKLVCPVTSDDIEKHFLKSQHTPLTFKNASYTYVLDFNTMTQTNQSTNVKREVRRRPKPHLKDENHRSGQKASINKT